MSDDGTARQRWTVGGSVVWCDRNPCEINAAAWTPEDPGAVHVSLPVGHELAAHLVDGAVVVVDLVGPRGELRWLEGRVGNVELGAERLSAVIRAPL